MLTNFSSIQLLPSKIPGIVLLATKEENTQ